MKIERAYLGDALRHLRSGRRPHATRPVAYRTTGETVGTGTYHCTLCGRATELSRPGTLPLCSFCDGSEFIDLATPAEVAAADDQSAGLRGEPDAPTS